MKVPKNRLGSSVGNKPHVLLPPICKIAVSGMEALENIDVDFWDTALPL